MRLEEIEGTEIYKDVRLGHTWYEVGVLRTVLLPLRHDWTFIEIGVHEGGLSMVLLPMFSNYIGVELDCGIVRPEVKALYHDKGAELICGDCFSDDLFWSLNSIEKKIIYCDGGHKAKEIVHFKDLCQQGDILLTHDFWDGESEVYGVSNIAPEVTVDDIKPFEDDIAFLRLSHFDGTRIAGWLKDERLLTIR